MKLIFSAFDEQNQAWDILLARRYEPPLRLLQSRLLDELEFDIIILPENRYLSVIWDSLIGHCCFGDEAQVQGRRLQSQLLMLDWIAS